MRTQSKLTHLFFGGLHPSVTAKDIVGLLPKRTKLARIVLKRDRNSGISKGYGFLTCSLKDALMLENSNMFIGDRRVIFQIKDQSSGKAGPNRLFIGGVPSNVKDCELAEAFSLAFGPVRTAFAIKDIATQKHRGFGYVDFYENEDMESALKARNIWIKNVFVQIKRFFKNYTSKKKTINNYIAVSQQADRKPQSKLHQSHSNAQEGENMMLFLDKNTLTRSPKLAALLQPNSNAFRGPIRYSSALLFEYEKSTSIAIKKVVKRSCLLNTFIKNIRLNQHYQLSLNNSSNEHPFNEVKGISNESWNEY